MKIHTLEMSTRVAWRNWLETHHESETEIWLIYYKKGMGKTGVDYEASVEEALCFGWIDSLIKRIDDQRYARKFTPRKAQSQWSESNKQRIAKLLKAGLMTKAGLELLEAAKSSGNWHKTISKPEFSYEMPATFADALKKNARAANAFRDLPPSYQRQYLAWIEAAKRVETRDRRITESIRLLSQGRKLGLK